ncbi:MAG TPA: YbhN family protein, partial [Tepidisphaeraceae bacterium]|nr:YbhN family protein [Tepidisphaeraceae bacterium]
GRRLFWPYAYVVLKNLIGWLLILFSLPAGALIPGPGGLPMFLIGFAMISFPGKRKLTARVLYGKPIPYESRAYQWSSIAVALLAPVGVLAYLYANRHDPWFEPVAARIPSNHYILLWAATYVSLASALMLLLLPGRVLMNRAMRVVPRVRRKVRPWLRRKGIDLLPPRRRRRPVEGGMPDTRDPDPEILEIDERHYRRAWRVWKASKPWLKRALGAAVTVLIFYYILKPIRAHWPDVETRIKQTDPVQFGIASAMFTLFLAFRAVSWRRILIGLGHRLPIAPVMRIWSTSELARYLPGTVAQVVGRAYLVGPYGVSKRVSTTSQLLELSAFLLANVIVAVVSLIWFGFRAFDADARPWLIAACVLVPTLGVFLHPTVFYGLLDRLMVRLRRPPIATRFSGWALTRLVLRMLGALIWQGVAVFVLVQPVLQLPAEKWYLVAGAYSLAWCAGFLAFWAPGGIGVREVVFVATLQSMLRELPIRAAGTSLGELYFLSILLRLWTVAGELVLAGAAYALDVRGAIGRHGDGQVTAAGRPAPEEGTAPPTSASAPPPPARAAAGTPS